ncbi:MAG: extracellular solute-binding protein [Chloroflexi bacterium]|nr:extracellular solute-binding protein [Chloroflexota bacterium]
MVVALTAEVLHTQPGASAEVENIVTASGAGGGWFDKLLVQAAAGTTPEVLAFEDLRGIPAATQGVTQPLDAYLKGGGVALKEYDPVAIRGFNLQGKQIGIPWRWDVNLLYVNRDLLETATVSFPKNDWTLDQWMDVLRKVSRPAATPPVFGYDTHAGFGGGQFNFWGMFGNDYLNAARSKTLLREASSEQALQFLVDLVKRWHVAPDHIKGEQKGVNFTQGNVGFALDSTARIARYRPGGDRPLEFAWDVVPLPRGPARSFASANGSAWYLSAITQAPALCWELIKSYTSREAQLKIAQAGANVPRPDVARLPQLRPADMPPRNWAGIDAAARVAVPFPVTASFIGWRDKAAGILLEAVDGTRGTRDALSAAADLIEQELEKERQRP